LIAMKMDYKRAAGVAEQELVPAHQFTDMIS